jgi:hypothetical protein
MQNKSRVTDEIGGMTQKTFLLGLGAQKAGTTWLHRYISGFANVDTGLFKEYQIWNAVHFKTDARFKVPLWQVAHPKARLRWRLQHSEKAYFDYFEGLLRQPGISMTADITPNYAPLSAAVLKKIRQGFEARGIKVKVVFLMRDPVQRCWSALRMIRKNGRKGVGVDLEAPEADALRRYAASSWAQSNARYDLTVARIDEVFAAEDVFYGFYESLFTAESVGELSRFLELPPDTSFSEKKFNVSEKAADMPEDLMKAIADQYSSVYAWCNARFPETQSLWRHFP